MDRRPLDATGFEWDEANVLKIREKHGVSPAECEEVFFNRPLLSGPDEKHSLGQTDSGRPLFIVFTVRRKLVRVITARDMSRREREVFASHEEKE